jgi:hypothetical protein
MPSVLPPCVKATFPELKQLAGDQNPKPEITISSWTVRSLVELLLSFWPFDEQWYLSTYPDIAEAVRQGEFPSGRDHYRDFGYFEGRLPFKPEVDAEWYAKEYPDVAESIGLGILQSALEHFVAFGYREGRQPMSGPSDSKKQRMPERTVRETLQLARAGKSIEVDSCDFTNDELVNIAAALRPGAYLKINNSVSRPRGLCRVPKIKRRQLSPAP